uniref:mercuric resistance transcriptional repressor MerD n=1 Tax=Klebsiella sp. FR21MBA2675 TaxID=3381300 RepID=UPI003A969D42
MNAYTVSRLALDAGVSVHIVRDYLLRGLLRPVACTTGGYGLFDDAALQRLCFVWAAFEAGIGLGALARSAWRPTALPDWPTLRAGVRRTDAAQQAARQFHRSSPHPAPGTAAPMRRGRCPPRRRPT